MRLRERWEQWTDRLRHLTRADIEHYVFWTIVLLKAADALFEIVGGIVLIFISAQTINAIVHGLVRPELTEDPGDFIARLVLKYLGHVSAAAKLFAVIYLLTHGVVKLFVVGALWLKQLWAYPLAGLVFVGFIVYQMFRFAHTYAISMLALTVLDLILIALLPPEYRRVKAEIERRRKRR